MMMLFRSVLPVLLALIFAGCESKFKESSPDKVDLKGISLQERVDQKIKVDLRIDEIQKGADKIKKIIEMFKKIKNPTAQMDTYTPIDFLLDLNQELKAQIPEVVDERLVRRATVNLPIADLSEECQKVESILTTESIAGIESLSYSLKPCGSEEYFDVIEATSNGSTLEIRMINKNIEKVFKDIFVTDAIGNASCSVKNDHDQIIDSISCSNLSVGLSKSEAALFKLVTFSNSDDIRFEAVADVSENNVVKAQVHIKVLSNSETKINVRKVGDEQ